ncbi:MAG: hypothetical protein B6240_07030 [Desulfobacteraceae bacterium 4572_87]|nr:MAG: hypothetical protein B6240_07030 [Desulfobacteraceae bacterium 4572_87]
MANEGDVILIYHENSPTVFARVEDISPDIKKDWYHITLLLLTLPTQQVTWILKDAYIGGEEFTMGGKPMRLEAVKRVMLEEVKKQPIKKNEEKAPRKRGDVVPFKKP